MTHPNILLSPLKSIIPAQGGAFDILVRVQGPNRQKRPRARSLRSVSLWWWIGPAA